MPHDIYNPFTGKSIYLTPRPFQTKGMSCPEMYLLQELHKILLIKKGGRKYRYSRKNQNVTLLDHPKDLHFECFDTLGGILIKGDLKNGDSTQV